ncbi:MAG: SLATT domain-containing protein [Ignavibacteriales bacterium]|nr:SLATT domain-containing protein [Ignavibacteriales bacterium]
MATEQMDNTKERLKRIKVDAVYGKKKHFNAADRKNKIHYWIGIPLIVLNTLTGSLFLYEITWQTKDWIKYIPLVFAVLATLLSGFQTFLNLQKSSEGHRRVGNKYLVIMKKCDMLYGYIQDGLLEKNDIVERLGQISSEMEQVNAEAESFVTNKADYEFARKGIELGEESYTTEELDL